MYGDDCVQGQVPPTCRYYRNNNNNNNNNNNSQGTAAKCAQPPHNQATEQIQPQSSVAFAAEFGTGPRLYPSNFHSPLSHLCATLSTMNFLAVSAKCDDCAFDMFWKVTANHNLSCFLSTASCTSAMLTHSVTVYLLQHERQAIKRKLTSLQQYYAKQQLASCPCEAQQQHTSSEQASCDMSPRLRANHQASLVLCMSKSSWLQSSQLVSTLLRHLT